MCELVQGSHGPIGYRPDAPPGFNGYPSWMLDPRPRINRAETEYRRIAELFKVPFTEPKTFRRALLFVMELPQCPEQIFGPGSANDQQQFIGAIHAKGATAMWIPVDGKPGRHKPQIITPDSPPPRDILIRIMQRAAGPGLSPCRIMFHSQEDVVTEFGPDGCDASDVFETKKLGVPLPSPVMRYRGDQQEWISPNTPGPTSAIAERFMATDFRTIMRQLRIMYGRINQPVGIEGYVGPETQYWVDTDLPNIDVLTWSHK